jgi:hypothetical protein
MAAWREGLTYRPVVAVVSDPMDAIDHLLDLEETLAGGGRSRSRWFSEYTTESRGAGVSRVGRTMTFRERACCFEHLASVEHLLARVRLPYETRCPVCQRLMRIELRAFAAPAST